LAVGGAAYCWGSKEFGQLRRRGNNANVETNTGMAKVLTYHVVPGSYDASALEKMIKKGGGRAMLKTASGGTLTASMNGARNIVIMDESGGTARISTYNVYQSNGVIHVVDKVVLPKM